VTEGGVIEHARRKGRGRGWWENGIISVGLIHHGDWRCLHTGAVGFVLAKYYSSCVGVTKLLGRNCHNPDLIVRNLDIVSESYCLRSFWRRERRSRKSYIVRTDFHLKSGPLGPKIPNSLKGQRLVSHNCFRPTSPNCIEL
jgi:hypothetical protein